jgi:hypothetical protein
MNFTFPLEAVNLILHALSKLPYEQSADMIAEIRKQAQPQVDALQAAPVATESAE